LIGASFASLDECRVLSDLIAGSALYSRDEELSGHCVLLATKDQLTTASAPIELNGVAQRLVLCPLDVLLEQFAHILAAALLLPRHVPRSAERPA
jgi:hypothetical protein